MSGYLTTHWITDLRQDSSGHSTSLDLLTEEYLDFAVNPALSSIIIPVSSISSTWPNSPNLLTSHTSHTLPARPYLLSRSTSPALFVSSIPSLISESDK
ncbi:hypothetical protein G6F56_000459 [Rhizopus delemar]|nr:hypothetical protein G6F56_000459 [Rhizopus delemar]